MSRVRLFKLTTNIVADVLITVYESFLKPLMIAAQHEDCDVSILALLGHGCDPNIQDYNVSNQSS